MPGKCHPDIGSNHFQLVRLRSHLIVDIRKAEGFCKPPAGKENAVLPYLLDGNHILDFPGNHILLPILTNQAANGFHHALYSSFSRLEMVSSKRL